MSRDRDPEFDVGIECRHAHATWLRLGNRGDLADRYAYGSAFNQGLLDERRTSICACGWEDSGSALQSYDREGWGPRPLMSDLTAWRELDGFIGAYCHYREKNSPN